MSLIGRTGLGVVCTLVPFAGLGVAMESFGLGVATGSAASWHAGAIAGPGGASVGSDLMPRQALDGAGMLAVVGRLRAESLGVQGVDMSCRCWGIAGPAHLGGSSLQARLLDAVGAGHAFLVGRALPGMRDSEL